LIMVLSLGFLYMVFFYFEEVSFYACVVKIFIIKEPWTLSNIVFYMFKMIV
jgi:hypothetical protein